MNRAGGRTRERREEEEEAHSAASHSLGPHIPHPPSFPRNIPTRGRGGEAERRRGEDGERERGRGEEGRGSNGESITLHRLPRQHNNTAKRTANAPSALGGPTHPHTLQTRTLKRATRERQRKRRAHLAAGVSGEEEGGEGWRKSSTEVSMVKPSPRAALSAPVSTRGPLPVEGMGLAMRG